MHGALWNAIFTSLIGKEIDVIDTLRFNNDAIFYIDWQQHRECDQTVNIGDQQNSHKHDKWQTSVDSLASSDIGEVLS